MEASFDQIAGVTFAAFAVIAGMVAVWLGRAVILRWMDISQDRAHLKHEQEIQRIAHEASHAREAVAEQTKRFDALEGRLASIERILREVDEPVLARR